MKIRKNAEQKNFLVDIGNYTERELEKMLDSKRISDLQKIFPDCFPDHHLVVFAEDCEKIEVRYDKEFGNYYAAAVLLDGTEVRVTM